MKIEASVSADRWMIKLTRFWKIWIVFSASCRLTGVPIAVCLQGCESRTRFFLGMETRLLLEGSRTYQSLRLTAIPLYYRLAYHWISSTMNILPSDQVLVWILTTITSSFRTGHAMANSIPAGWQTNTENISGSYNEITTGGNEGSLQIQLWLSLPKPNTRFKL